MGKAERIRRRGRWATVAPSFALVAVMCGAQTKSSGAGASGVQSGSHQTGASTGTASSGGGNTALGPTGGLDVVSSPFPDNGRQKRNEERQRKLVNDTERLVALTAQLKAEVASSGAETMSPEMMKQMEQIEKLAKSVKDRMRD